MLSPVRVGENLPLEQASHQNEKESGPNHPVYMSAHNPQTPSNAQIRIFEQEGAAENAGPGGAASQSQPSDRFYQSQTESSVSAQNQ